MTVSKLDVDDVEARLCWFVVNIQSSILIVLAVNLRLGGTLNGQRQSSVASTLGVDEESVVDMSLALDKTVSGHLDSAGVTHLLGVDHDLEGAVGDVLPILLDTDQVLTHLPRCEANANVATGQLLEETLLNDAGGRLNVSLQ